MRYAGRRLGLMVLACVAIVAVTACGSSSKSKTSTSGPRSTAATSSSSSSSSSAFPAAAAANAKFEKRPTSIGITKPVGKPIPKGKTIDFIQLAIPADQLFGNVLAQGAQALGWKLVRISSGLTPQAINAAYAQAVRNKPSAVISTGVPRVLYNTELKQLAAEHVPVVQSFVTDKPGNGLTGVVAGYETPVIAGRQIADYMLANSTDKSQTIGSVFTNTYPSSVILNTSLTATIKQNCSGCSVKDLVVPATSIGSDLPSRVSTFLSANPNLSWTNVGYDDMMVGVPTALKGASVTGAKLTTLNLNPAVYPYLKGKDYLQAAMGASFPEIQWRALDLLARYFTHQSYAVDLDDATLPYWTITAANAPANAGSAYFSDVADYQAQFKKLWGVH